MNDESIGFEFAPTGGGTFTGANDPLSTNLQGGFSITSILARESIQNARDAQDPNSTQPVEITFSLIPIKPSQIPNIKSLRNVLIACRDLSIDKKDVVDFYNSAIFKIDHDNYIDLMKISDYNTTGLTGGDNDIKGNFFLLMHSEGWTEKGSGQGGSWGLGKGAYFNASSFNTFFVSSIYGKNKSIFLGRSNLASHIFDNIPYQGNGSYGKKGQKAVTDPKQIPSVFSKSEQGTDIYIMGFEEKNWEKQILDSVLNFFWYPILKGKLKIEIGNYSINENTIDRLIKENFDEFQKEKPNSENPLPYYFAYTGKDSEIIEEDLPLLGKVSLHILKKNKYPQKIALMRKPGMIIMKKPRGSLMDYAAVFICDNKKGDEILTAMESPKHDTWDPQYASRKATYYEKTKEAILELNAFLTKSIKKITPNVSSSSKIGDLDKYLSLEGDEDSDTGSTVLSEGTTEIESEKETATLIASLNDKKLRQVNEVLIIDEIKQEMKGESGGDLPIVSTHEGKGGENTGGSLNEDGDKKVLIDGVTFRTFDTESGNRIIHDLILKGNIDRDFNVEIKAGTDDSLDPVEILQADDEKGNKLKVEDNIIKNLSLKNSGQTRLRMVFKENERFALNVIAYEI